jgi:NADPH:quinone reductase-like Zn-dependent oxidoreductase
VTLLPESGRQLRSSVHDDGTLELRVVSVPVAAPGPDDVVIRVEAAPINPSDLALLLAGADPSTLEVADHGGQRVVRARIAAPVLRALAGRLGASLPVGNEGAGTVIAAGASPAATALLGRTVAAAGGAMYAQYRTLPAGQCLVLPEGTPSRAGASANVNPLTALAMVATMRAEGHVALVHTAAASNLGQMLVRLCRDEGIALVNVVRRPEQEELLRALGARYVVAASSATFMSDLVAAVSATSATLAFDATGGGSLASQILSAMEAAATDPGAPYSRYGSTTHKQVYVYGGLDPRPLVLTRNFGFAWGVGGFLVTTYLQRLSPDALAALRHRVATSLTTTFASAYTREVSLDDALEPAVIARYARQATGEKFLITPSSGASEGA